MYTTVEEAVDFQKRTGVDALAVAVGTAHGVYKAQPQLNLERLREMGGRNLQLLVICQKADAVHFPAEHPDYFLRTVSRYNPDWQVTTEQLGDRFGWTMIWKEFAPLHVMKQSKKYKFDR